jgi:hypothetical protein
LVASRGVNESSVWLSLSYLASAVLPTGGELMAQKDMLSARERRLRRVASRKGLSLRRVRRGQDRGRYLLVDPDFDAAMSSPNRRHPHSFSLEEAEKYVGQ